MHTLNTMASGITGEMAPRCAWRVPDQHACPHGRRDTRPGSRHCFAPVGRQTKIASCHELAQHAWLWGRACTDLQPWACRRGVLNGMRVVQFACLWQSVDWGGARVN